MSTFVFIHYIIGWLLLLILLISVIISGFSYKKKKSSLFPKIYLFAMILSHIQVVIGLYQYFQSSKVYFGEGLMSNSMLRFFTVEHPLLMIIGVVIITIGYTKSKKKELANKSVFIYYSIGLLIILSRFPWQYLTSM